MSVTMTDDTSAARRVGSDLQQALAEIEAWAHRQHRALDNLSPFAIKLITTSFARWRSPISTLPVDRYTGDAGTPMSTDGRTWNGPVSA